ncbi:MAG: hypothetical protein NC222_06990 [Staphylococcus sp.]|nr:hypothetical protein [Staphylococcus sp.]
MFNTKRIEKLEEKFDSHIKQNHVWRENDLICYATKDKFDDYFRVKLAKIIKVIYLEAYSACDSQESLIVENYEDNSVCKIKGNDAFASKEEAEVRADIRNIKVDIARIKNKLNMKKLYLTYQDYQALGSLQKGMRELCEILFNKKGCLTANEKEQKFTFEGEFTEEDVEKLKKYGWR